MNKTKFRAFFIAFLLSMSLFSQDVISLKNPSFEDLPRHSRQPAGWYDCGFPGESPPDTQPGQFEVSLPPANGQSYLAMVARENETWESVGQKLNKPLLAEQVYSFKIFLCRSAKYLSPTKGKDNNKFFMKNCTTPLKLKIWGGNSYYAREELLGETELIINLTWTEYSFYLKPSKNYNFVLFEAVWKENSLFPYNGNLLLDNASDFIPTNEMPSDSLTVPDPEFVKKQNQIWAEILLENQKNVEELGTIAELSPPVKPYKPTARQNLKGLKKLIKAKGADIEFNQEENDLTEESKNNLNYIVNRLNSIPEKYRLIVAFHENIPNTDEKTAVFLDYFESAGLEESNFTIRAWKDQDHRRKWHSDTGMIRIGLAEEKN